METKPDGIALGRCVSFAVFVLCLAILLTAHFIQLDRLPVPRCAFLRVTNYPCPFCGTTRSFLEAAKGHWGSALQHAPLGVLVYLGLCLIGVWCLFRTVLPSTKQDALWETPPPRALFYGVATVIIANWVYRLAMGYK